jgi:alpha-beta hydrolase superfamily lysophospholipase
MSRKTAPQAPRTTLDRVMAVAPSFDGTEIHFDVYGPPSPISVLVVPGFWRDRTYPSMQSLAALLTGLGYRTAIMDVRGHGSSGGTYGFNIDEHYDVAAVARTLLSRFEAESIVLMGFSVGGAIATSTAARDALPIQAQILVSPVAELSRVMPRFNPFTIHRHIAFSQALNRPRFSLLVPRGAVRLQALDDVSRVHAPLCLIHVRNDWLVGHRHSIRLYERANEPKELHIIDIPGQYHADRIFTEARESAEVLVADFLSRFARQA